MLRYLSVHTVILRYVSGHTTMLRYVSFHIAMLQYVCVHTVILRYVSGHTAMLQYVYFGTDSEYLIKQFKTPSPSRSKSQYQCLSITYIVLPIFIVTYRVFHTSRH